MTENNKINRKEVGLKQPAYEFHQVCVKLLFIPMKLISSREKPTVG
jgi:hypothetical protein